jgi:hypothetical protein
LDLVRSFAEKHRIRVLADVFVTVAVHDEGLKSLLMSWYYAGYYTGLYEGQHQAKQP